MAVHAFDQDGLAVVEQLAIFDLGAAESGLAGVVGDFPAG